MLKAGTRVFFQRPEEFTARMLHAATTVSVVDTQCVAMLDAPLDLEVDQSVLIYYEINREFVQQPARIMRVSADAEADATHAGARGAGEAAVPDDPPLLRVEFATTGFVMSAESRACYRVTTVSANLTAQLGDERSCPLIDVSASGFSVASHAIHRRGEVLPATLRYEDKTFVGKACVQSVKTLVTGETRYGLSGLDAGRGSIGQGQARITMEVQRDQLRRQRGTQ